MRKVRSGQIADIAAMLAVDPYLNTGSPCRRGHFQCRQIACVQNGGAQFAQQAEHPRKKCISVPRRLVKCEEFNIVACDACTEIGDFSEGDDGMPKGRCRHVIDQVHDSIL